MTKSLPLLVDVFFVISGFIITYVYRNRVTSVQKYGIFLQRRVGRIYPLHLLTLLVYFAVAILIQIANIKMTHYSSTDPRCLAVTALLIQALVPCSGMQLNGVTWSLSAEMVMYALFPVFIWLTGRKAWRSAIVTIVSFAVVIWISGIHHPWQSNTPLARALPAFMIGMTACFARERLLHLPAARSGLAGGVILFFIGSAVQAPNVFMVILAYAIPLFAIAADAQGRSAPGIRRWAPLGQLTYPIYMIHGLLIMLVLNAVGDKLLHLSTLPMLALGLMTYAMIGMLSWASHQLFEQPVRQWVDGLFIFSRPSHR